MAEVGATEDPELRQKKNTASFPYYAETIQTFKYNSTTLVFFCCVTKIKIHIHSLLYSNTNNSKLLYIILYYTLENPNSIYKSRY